jgi:hypothetical protein
MKLLIMTLLTFALTLQAAKADCDYSKIVSNADGTYTYSKELNHCVGVMKKDLDATKAQMDSYVQSITLKDLALSKADERIKNWQDNSDKLENRLNTIDSLEKKNEWLFFALGIVVTSAAVYGASKLSNR